MNYVYYESIKKIIMKNKKRMNERMKKKEKKRMNIRPQN